MTVNSGIVMTISSVLALSTYLIPIQAQSRISVITGSDNYEINKFQVSNGVSFVVQRLSNSNPSIVEYILNIYNTSQTEFRFEKSQYTININPTVIGIIGQFTVLTNATGCLAYGLSSDDVYINKVFRVGPDSGILYADSPIAVGVYNFNVTADITNKQLHAVAKVTVNVKPVKKTNLTLNNTNLNFKLYGILTDADSKNKSTNDKEEKQREDLEQVIGDVNTNQIVRPSQWKLWRKIIKENFTIGPNDVDENRSINISQETSERERSSLFSQLVPTNSRHKRAIPRSDISTGPKSTFNVASTATTVLSKRIYQESSFEEIMMSGYIIFVVSFGTIFFFGSIFYFGYKRLKRCGDYSVEVDAKSTKNPSDDETVYSTVQSDLKNPYILDLKQNRVVDSIEITKQKLTNGPASVFTIQRSYEEESVYKKDSDDDDDKEMYVVDMTQFSIGPGSEFSKILLKSNSASTPTITATLIEGQENSQDIVPQSILSTSRRNSISSRKDSSLGSSIGDLTDGSRRKSVTFSDIVELYRVS